MPRLSTTQIKTALPSVPQWRKEGKAITRTYEFRDFVEAVRFVNAVARLAERAWHHPDIDVRWNRVTLTLSTHDEGGLTRKDFTVARHCDEAAARIAPRHRQAET